MLDGGSNQGGAAVRRGVVVAAVHGGRNVLERAYAESPLRLLLPKVAGAKAAWVCVTSFGGGLVRGDALAIDVDVKEDAALLMTTQASTKAYRGRTRQTLRVRVDGTLMALPDPVACFAGATYDAEMDVTLGPRGSIVLVDAFTSGRPAYGERWAFERFSSRIRIGRTKVPSVEVRSGDEREPVVYDATLLDARHGPVAGRFGRVEACATLIAVGPHTRSVMASLQVPSREASLLYAPSRLPRDEGVLARVSGERIEDVLREVRHRLRNVAEICGVDPYASRH